jgi:purine-binding chemotaxis protein CheW
MNFTDHIVVFTLDGQRFALPLPAVSRVIHAVEITPLPKAPEIVSGVINLEGHVLPVLDVRRRFRLPAREPDPGDRIVIARTPRRCVALVTDSVEGVMELPAGMMVAPDEIAPGIEYVQGVVRCGDGMILIHDIGTFLSLDEAQRLEEALIS